MMSYPENCIRGIQKTSFIEKRQDRHYVTAEAYQFIRNQRRPDGMYEASVNWADDQDAIEFTFDQKNNNGSLKFEGGVVSLPHSELDIIRNQYGSMQFNYERATIQENKYHGNLLLNSSDMTPITKSMIRAVLAHRSEILSRDSA